MEQCYRLHLSENDWGEIRYLICETIQANMSQNVQQKFFTFYFYFWPKLFSVMDIFLFWNITTPISDFARVYIIRFYATGCWQWIQNYFCSLHKNIAYTWSTLESNILFIQEAEFLFVGFFAYCRDFIISISYYISWVISSRLKKNNLG